MSGYSIKQTGDDFIVERNSDKAAMLTIDENGGMSNYGATVTTITATDSLTQAEHGGRVNLLGEVGGNALVTLTLPAATGTGAVFRFIVSVVNTSNYVIKVANASDTIDGSVNLLDADAAAQTAYTATGTSDTITLNGTTTGGQLGDEIVLTDIATNQWAVNGQLVCPTGSNPATPFSATVA